MGYGIEYFCGSKFGGWRLGGVRYPSEDAARTAAAEHGQAERAAELTPFTRRIRAA